MVEYKCTQCDIAFSSRKKRDHHYKSNHQTKVAVSYQNANGEPPLNIEIERNEAGLFKCIRCLKELSIRSIHRHAKFCVVSDEQVIIPVDQDSSHDSDSFQLDSPEILSSTLTISEEDFSLYCHDLPFLKSFNIFLLKDYGIFCCFTCKIGVYPKQIEAHLRNRHGKTVTREIQESIKNELEIFESFINFPDLAETNLLSDYLYPSQEEKTAIPLLPVITDGFMCPVCDAPAYFACQEKRMLLHFSKEHRNQTLTSISCHLQQLYKSIPSNGRLYFRVRSLEAATISRDDSLDNSVNWINDLLETINDMSNDNENETNEDERIGAWLKMLNWPNLVRHIDGRLIVDFVAEANADDQILTTTAVLCEKFIHDTMKQLNDVNFTIRREIMSRAIDPKQTFFSSLLLSDTVKKYASLYSRMLNSLIRSVTDAEYSIFPALRSSLREATLEYIDSLNAVDDERNQMKAFIDLNKKLWIYDFDYRTEMNSQDCPVYRFIVYYSCNAQKQFISAKDLTPVLAKVQYVARCVIFSTILESFEVEADKKVAISEYQRLLTYVDEKGFTPFTRLRELMHLATTVATETFSDPQLDWVPGRNYDCIMVKGDILELDALSKAYRDGCRLAQSCLKSLMLDQKLPECSLNNLQPDLLNCKDVGFSFLNDKRNGLQKKKNDFLNSFMNNESFKSKFILSLLNGRPVWNVNEISEWFRQSKEFVYHLIFLVHISSGQPARGPELETYRIVNGSADHGRSIYSLMGTFMMVTTYWKGSNTSQKDKPIARFLPSDLAQLLLKYLTFVRPLETIFTKILSERNYGSFRVDTSISHCKEFLFYANGRKMNSREIKNAFRSTFKELVGIDLSFSMYRQIAQAFSNKKLIPVAENEDQNSLRYLVDKQAGRTPAVSGAFYGRTISEDHNSLSRDSRENFFKISQQWHSLLKIGGELRNQSHIHNLMSVRNSNVQNDTDDVNDIQQQQPTTVITHIINSSSVHPKCRVLLPKTNMNHSSMSSCLTTLRKLYNGSSHFKSPSQALSCELVASRKTDVLVVLPTGGGKTAVILVPALMDQSRTTLIILPLVALLNEMIDRCTEFGLTTMHWRNTRECLESFNPRNPPQIICVSVENAVNEKLLESLKIMIHFDKLSRIVIDEAHLALTTSSYRPKMTALLQLKTLPVPFVFLSATVPPSMEPLLQTKFASSFATVRESTVRGNLFYKTVTSKKKSEAFDLLSTKMDEIIEKIVDDEERIIVFCLSKKDAEDVQENLKHPCSIYHSAMPDLQKRSEDQKWRQGINKIIVATTAFGAGIDYPKVRYVLHYGGSHSIIDYAQECGRAGRDGEPAECVTFSWENWHKQFSSEDETDYKSIVEVIENTHQCRRFLLHEYLDEVGYSCLSLGEKCRLCDICDEELKNLSNTHSLTWTSSQNSVQVLPTSWFDPLLEESTQEAQQTVNLQVHIVTKVIDFLKDFNQCPICFVTGKTSLGCPGATMLFKAGFHHNCCIKCFTFGVDSRHSNCQGTTKVNTKKKGIYLCFFCGLPDTINVFGTEFQIHSRHEFATKCNSVGKDKSIPLASALFVLKGIQPLDSNFNFREFRERLYDINSNNCPNVIQYLYDNFIRKM